MTIQPVAPLHLLTVAEYLEIGEVEPGYTELVEGRLLISPSPVPDHNYAAAELRDQLRPQLPSGIEASRTWMSTCNWPHRMPPARSAVPT